MQIQLHLDSFKQGISESISPKGSPAWFLSYRLTAAKEKGENIIIDGKPVALGIPGAGQRDNGKPVPGIPLGRGATPDEAANSILL